MSLKRKRTPSPPSDDTQASSVFRSSPIHDRSSTFIAYFSHTIAPKTLQKSKEVETASHRILGWRRPSPQQSIVPSSTGSRQLYVTSSEDDGEKYGGKRLEKLLEAEDVEGAVMVARWYGGVLLGPVRFTHIENCAREAIREWKAVIAETESKKRRLETEELERQNLVTELGDRDQSIITLRGLLAEKLAVLEQAEASDPTKTSTPTKAIDYNALPLPRLKALERARDASIAFLLKKIDAAEEQQQHDGKAPLKDDSGGNKEPRVQKQSLK